MKKLSLSPSTFNGEVLSRNELKKVLGGSGSGNVRFHCEIVISDEEGCFGGGGPGPSLECDNWSDCTSYCLDDPCCKSMNCTPMDEK